MLCLKCQFCVRQYSAEPHVTNESETVVPSFQVQSTTTQHQDTMSLQDIDLGLMQDDQTDYEDHCNTNKMPHIERTLTEESAGKICSFFVLLQL